MCASISSPTVSSERWGGIGCSPHRRRIHAPTDHPFMRSAVLCVSDRSQSELHSANDHTLSSRAGRRPHCWRQLYPSAALRRKNDSNHVPQNQIPKVLQLSSYSGTGPWKSSNKQTFWTDIDITFLQFRKKMWKLGCRWLPWCCYDVPSIFLACFYVL